MNYKYLATSVIATVFAIGLTSCGGEMQANRSSSNVSADSPTSEGDSPKLAENTKMSATAQGAAESSSVVSTQTETVPVAETSAEDPLLKRGKLVWFKCRSCHEFTVDGPHKVGPNLNGVFGATAGSKEGFVYSTAMKESGIVWTDETLNKFITKPADFVKGTKMAFIGIKDENDRKAVLAYLKVNAAPEK